MKEDVSKCIHEVENAVPHAQPSIRPSRPTTCRSTFTWFGGWKKIIYVLGDLWYLAYLKYTNGPCDGQTAEEVD